MQSSLISPSSELPFNELALMRALDQVYIMRKYDEIGSCALCRKISEKKCSCGTHYCSVKCQNADWPNHKLICAKMIDTFSEYGSVISLAPKISSKSSVTNYNDPLLSKDHLVMKASGSPFKVLANQVNEKWANSSDENQSISGKSKFSKSRNYQNDNFSKPRGNDNNRGTKWQNKNGRNNFQKPGSVIHEQKNSNFNQKQNFKTSTPEQTKEVSRQNIFSDVIDLNYGLLKPIENIPQCMRKNEPVVAKKQKKEVIFICRESADRYWVMNDVDLLTFENIQRVLAEKCDGFEKADLKEGLICGVTFADEWYRGRIISLTPKPMVHFIDYGNTSECEAESIKKLPIDLRSRPGLVYLIEFEEGVPSRYRTEDLDATKMTVEETGETSDGVTRVRIFEGPNKSEEKPKVAEKSENENFPVNSSSAPSGKRSVMDVLTEDSKGIILFIPGEGRVRFGSIVLEDNEDARRSVDRILNLSISGLSPIEAKEGDYVMLKDREGNDQRGKVFSRLGSVYYVDLIDSGVFMLTDCVYSLAEDAKNLMELGVKITLLETYSSDSLTNVETLFFHVTGDKVSGMWPCALKSPSEQELVAKALIGRPPETPELEPKRVSLKSGSVVVISALSTPDSFYIRAVDENTERNILEMNMKMAQFSVKAESLKSPKVGDLCCAKFSEDGCFYRAEVKSVENNKANMLFVDFGNKQDTNLEDVKPIPNGLKLIPYFAVEVSLPGVAKPFTPSVCAYLRKLITNNVELILATEASDGKEVVLKEKATGVALNDFVEKLKEETKVERSPAQSDMLTDDTLKFMSLSVGSKYDLVVLYVSESEFDSSLTFWATDSVNENLIYVNTTLSQNIATYCGTCCQPYRPAVNELCLAEFEGAWYRALVREIKNETFVTFFLDFGNTCELTSDSIRKTKPEFMEVPVLAMNCTLSGSERYNKPELKKKAYIFLSERVNDCLVDVEVSKVENNTFSVTIPEIESIMTE